MSDKKIIDEIEAKYEQLGENHEAYLKGLLHAKPINYWDYIEVDTLLSLQKPRTNFKDEEVFIMYHQVTELILKMMIHELQQLVDEPVDEARWIDKLSRLNRYTSMLINSFHVMRSGMDYDDYNAFRSTLTPASGFQSAQFRFLELYCTRLPNLINQEGKKRLSGSPTVEEYFDHLYWKDAGLNRETGEKTLTLRQFEEKYQDQLIRLAQELTGQTVEDKVLAMDSVSDELLRALRTFDHNYNVTWPLVHLNTAQHYLDSRGEPAAATGGSEWKKYLHPKYQQRTFFPDLWSEAELAEWGRNTPDDGTSIPDKTGQ
jgi:tryptophan 2,3-dioxygenase